MQVYLVGGAVRDELLGLPVRERDWVVVGGTPAALEAQGYRAVGRDFPVFLHPATHEEYALARTERKSGPGYRGFSTTHDPSVTLEQDLLRRDLTVNAMARAADGTLVDPHGGRADLAARVLRHVSPAFAEDPVRILRAARFLARFAPLGFTVAPGTLALMHAMVEAGEVDALVPERVWKELERGLGEAAPEAMVRLLADCGALARLAPPLAAALASGGEAVLDPLRRAAQAGLAPAQRWAALVAPLGEAAADAMATALRTPLPFRESAVVAARILAAAPEGPWPAASLLELFTHCDALRRPERFASALAAAVAVRPALQAQATPLARALEAVRAVRLDEAEQATLRGSAIAARLKHLRLAALGGAGT